MIIPIDDLSRDMQVEIALALSETVSVLNNESTSYILDQLIGLVPETPVILTTANTEKMKSIVEKNWDISKENVKFLKKIIKTTGNLDPILTAHGKLLDGGHRVTLYSELGRKSIPAVDIGHLVDMDWNKWLNGAEVKFNL